MKVLASNEKADNYSCGFSKVVEFDNGKKFKIVHKTGNCFSWTKVYVMLPDLSWTEVANEFDLGSVSINYVTDKDRKVDEMATIYDKAISYIKAVFL